MHPSAHMFDVNELFVALALNRKCFCLPTDGSVYISTH
jgi:hypothetical protein